MATGNRLLKVDVMVHKDSHEIVFIAGSATGIGHATARVLARRGAAVAILDSDESAVADTVAECRAVGVHALGFAADPASPPEVAAAVRETVRTLGGLTAAVTNMSHDPGGTVADLDDGEWLKALSTNITGVLTVARTALPHLTGGGSFVAVSTTAGVRGVAGHAARSASAHAVVGLIRAMALDHGPHGLRSNAVCHGPVAADVIGPSAIRRVPQRRAGSGAEVAAAVSHLVSARSSYTNGAVHVVDGGLSAGYLEVADKDSTRC